MSSGCWPTRRSPTSATSWSPFWRWAARRRSPWASTWWPTSSPRWGRSASSRSSPGPRAATPTGSTTTAASARVARCSPRPSPCRCSRSPAFPLTAGFLGKFYVVTAGAGSRLWWLLIVLVASSTIGLYYYTRIVVAMYVQQPADDLAAGGSPRHAHARRQPGRRLGTGRRHRPRPVPGYLSLTTHQAARARRGGTAVTPVAARLTRSRPAR